MDAHLTSDIEALGARLKAARTLKHLKQDAVAAELSVTKGAISAWENGRNIPDALMLKRLARLYEISADALLWENALTTDAMAVAAQFDSLDERKRRTFVAMWNAYFAEAVSDEYVGSKIAPLPTEVRQDPEKQARAA